MQPIRKTHPLKRCSPVWFARHAEGSGHFACTDVHFNNHTEGVWRTIRANRKPSPPPRIFTIGHSNRSIQEFTQILEAYKLKLVVDIHTIPKSRHNPQFGGKCLANTLSKRNIEYIHMAGLGGFRHTTKTSVNRAWHKSSFRVVADNMQSDEFKRALHRLIARSKRKRLVIMCAEAVPWRCHRSLVAMRC